MARREGARIYFDRAETELIADGANIIGLAAPWIPDPTGTSQLVVATGAGACSLWARSAVRRGRCLGLKLPEQIGGIVVDAVTSSTTAGEAYLKALNPARRVAYPFEYRP
jgi:hypothetical protein